MYYLFCDLKNHDEPRVLGHLGTASRPQGESGNKKVDVDSRKSVILVTSIFPRQMLHMGSASSVDFYFNELQGTTNFEVVIFEKEN